MLIIQRKGNYWKSLFIFFLLSNQINLQQKQAKTQQATLQSKAIGIARPVFLTLVAEK